MSWKIQLPHWKIDHFVTKVVFVSFFNVHNTASYLWTCPYPKHPLLFNKVCVYQLFSWCPVNESVTSFSIHFLSFIFLSIPKTTTTYRTRWIDHKLRAKSYEDWSQLLQTTYKPYCLKQTRNKKEELNF